MFSDGFQGIDAAHELIRDDIRGVSPFSQAAKLITKVMIPDPFASQKHFEILPVEYRKFAPGNASHIDEGLDAVYEEYFDKVLFTPPACAKGKNLFWRTQ